MVILYYLIPLVITYHMILEQDQISTDSPEFDEAEKNVRATIDKLINNKGTKSVDHFHKTIRKDHVE